MKAKLMKAAMLLNEATEILQEVGDCFSSLGKCNMDYKTFRDFRNEMDDVTGKLLLSVIKLDKSISNAMKVIGKCSKEQTIPKVKEWIMKPTIDLSDAIEESDYVEGENERVSSSGELDV